MEPQLREKREQLKRAEEEFNKLDGEYRNLEKYPGSITRLEGYARLRSEAAKRVEKLKEDIRVLEGEMN